MTSNGFRVGALVVVNSVGRSTRGGSLHFWASPYERESEFGGLGFGPQHIDDHLTLRLKSDTPSSTDLAVVVTDAALTTTQLKRVAMMAQDGCALALRPAHAPMDNDVVFAAATARASPVARLSRPDRDRHARRRMRRARDCARRIRSLAAAAAGSAADMAGSRAEFDDRMNRVAP